ncbi:MAG: hypothetical protein WA952_13320 [Lewinella sp.]
MNLESAKESWQKIDTDAAAQLPSEHLEVRWSHPALRALRRQLVFEGVCWILFLALFYNGLDGDQRPWGWTAALVIGLLLLIVHAVIGYRLASRPVGAAPIREAIGKQVWAIRRYSWLSMALRTLTLLTLFGFLLSNVPDLWDGSRQWAIGTMVIWTGVALYIQHRLWRARIQELQATLDEFSA